MQVFLFYFILFYLYGGPKTMTFHKVV